MVNALYHLTSRGNAGNAIHLDDEDRQIFLVSLASAVTRFQWRLYAYCLMADHYHLLVQTPQPNLSKGMRQLNGVYTQRFNRRHMRPGHVFQGRFRAILVEQGRYLLELARHIVLNPIRTKVSDVETYEWSSYKATAGLQPVPKWLNADLVLDRFGVAKSSAQSRYIAFVKAGIDLPSIWGNLRQQIFLGSDQFVERMLIGIPRSDSLSEVPRTQRHPPVRPLATYANTHSDAAEAMIAAYQSGNYSLAAIGRYFGVHYSTVSRLVKMAEQTAEEK